MIDVHRGGRVLVLADQEHGLRILILLVSCGGGILLKSTWILWTSHGVQVVHVLSSSLWRRLLFLLSIRNDHCFVRVERLHVEELPREVGHSAIQRDQLLAIVTSFSSTGVLATEAALPERANATFPLGGPS